MSDQDKTVTNYLATPLLDGKPETDEGQVYQVAWSARKVLIDTLAVLSIGFLAGVLLSAVAFVSNKEG